MNFHQDDPNMNEHNMYNMQTEYNPCNYTNPYAIPNGQMYQPQQQHSPHYASLSTTTYVGTLCYMSPERLDGREYSFPTDIWAIGIIIYEMVTGQNPYPPTDKPIILNETMR